MRSALASPQRIAGVSAKPHTQRACLLATFTPMPRTFGCPPCRLFPDTQLPVRPNPRAWARFHRAEEGWGWARGETPHSRGVAVALVRKLNLSNLAGLGDRQVLKGGSCTIRLKPPGGRQARRTAVLPLHCETTRRGRQGVQVLRSCCYRCAMMPGGRPGRFSLPGGEHAAMRKAGERTLASVRCPMRGGVDREPHPSNWRLRTARDQSPARRL